MTRRSSIGRARSSWILHIYVFVLGISIMNISNACNRWSNTAAIPYSNTCALSGDSIHHLALIITLIHPEFLSPEISSLNSSSILHTMCHPPSPSPSLPLPLSLILKPYLYSSPHPHSCWSHCCCIPSIPYILVYKDSLDRAWYLHVRIVSLMRKHSTRSEFYAIKLRNDSTLDGRLVFYK